MLALVLLSVVVLLPTLGNGIENGADAIFHAHRIKAMSLLQQDGDLFPRWVPYFHLGYGYPIFNFYAPGATQIGGWLHTLGLSIPDAFAWTVVLAWVVGSLGMYAAGRTMLPHPAAFLAGVAWVLAPSHFYEVWWQGSLAQSVASAFMPWVVWGILSSSRQPQVRTSVGLGLAFAAVALSHTPTMYITAVFALPLIMLVPLIYRNANDVQLWQRYAGVIAGFVLAGGLSAIFLVPVLLETQYILIGQGLEDTNRFLLEHFIPFHHLLEIPQILDVTDQRIIIPQTLGAISLVLGGVGVVSLWLRGKRRLAALLLAVLLFTILMTNRVSFDLWLLIPQFNKLRFPDRILRMSTVLLALLIGGSIMVIPKRWQVVGCGGGVYFAVGASVTFTRTTPGRLQHSSMVAVCRDCV